MAQIARRTTRTLAFHQRYENEAGDDSLLCAEDSGNSFEQVRNLAKGSRTHHLVQKSRGFSPT
ncbi:hypothetical protein C0Q70_16501 [Pomacea canaliculata]|uniref:Uncharacterized protein n=1 Tax=Pomacea canaliculata TaxID=400727 RepID=A0A2T7NPZ0_POMCA|nr:hypothetical protein C0Q70_16501 [Pomacea canaliculata]